MDEYDRAETDTFDGTERTAAGSSSRTGDRSGPVDSSPGRSRGRLRGPIGWSAVLTLGGVGTLGLGYSLGHVLGASSPVFDRLVATSFPLAVSLGLLAASVGLYRGRFDVEYGTVLGWELVGVVVALGSLAWARAGTFPGATGDRFLPLVVVGAGALGGVLLALSRHRGERVEDLERYGAVVESTRDGLFAAADGTVTMVNPRMSELVGVDRERLVGADLDRLADRLLDEGDAGQSGAVVGDLAGRDPVEVTLTPVDRGPITCELEVSRLDQEGDHLVGMARDVSRYVRLRQQLSVTNRVLRHNLRTSTNLIAGHARIVEVDATDEATAERARSVRTEAQRLSTLADKARLLSEIVEEGHESRLVETDPADPIAEAVERVRADHGEAEYDVDVPPGLRVRAHPQIARAIAEAIENAVVHSGDATPWVSVAVVPGERFHEVRIADDGPGIPEYERGVLRRATESDLDHGSGIGLWLLRWVVDLSEGELAFEERPPTGSVVVVRLPAVDAPDGRDSPPADDPSG